MGELEATGLRWAGAGARPRLGVLDGDGIGPEVVPIAVAVVDAALAAVGRPPPVWQPLPMGLEAIRAHGSALPLNVLEALADLDGWVLGPHDSAAYPPGHRELLNPSGTIRKRFDLFANLRPARTLPGVPAPVSGLDVVVVRENTEGFYGDRNTFAGTGEWMPTRDVAVVQGVFTREALERVAHVACRLAARRSGRLTIVHKANVLRLTTGLLRDVAYEVAAGYPGLAVDDRHVDAVAALLVSRPQEFDVLLTENMHGDILSDLTAALSGSLGLAPSVNAAHDVAMAQAAHGSAPDIAGRDLANPLGIVLSAGQLLAWLGDRHADDELARAGALVDEVAAGLLAEGVATADLGGSAGTRELGERLVTRLGSAGQRRAGCPGNRRSPADGGAPRRPS